MAKQIVSPVRAAVRPSVKAPKASPGRAAAPTAPTAPKAPKAPQRPANGPRNGGPTLTAPTVEGARKLAKQAGASVTVAAAPKADASVMAMIEAQKAEIAKLTAALSKATAKAAKGTITLDEAQADAAKLPKGDTRKGWAGNVVNLQCFVIKNDELQIVQDGPVIPCLLAVPRDVDPNGASARAGGMTAVYDGVRSDGTYDTRKPLYLTDAELASVWIG